MFSVLLVGPISYVGGINVHIERLRVLLGEFVEFDHIDDAPTELVEETSKSIRRLRALPWVLNSIWRSDIVHIHSGNWLLRVLLILVSRVFGSRVVVTLHSYRLSGLKKTISDMVLRLSSNVICVNTDIRKSLGLNRALIKEAFLPPVKSETVTLPDEVRIFIEKHRDSVVACANAYRLTRHDGKDLYGLDQCLNVARIAKERGDKIAIIFVVGTVMSNDDLYYSSRKSIDEEGLHDFIKLYPRSLDFIALIGASDVVLRPTVTDGDALTIREALFLNKSVIASDVVSRPAGTILYKSEDFIGLYDAIKDVSATLSASTRSTDGGYSDAVNDYKEFYLEVYNECFS